MKETVSGLSFPLFHTLRSLETTNKGIFQTGSEI